MEVKIHTAYDPPAGEFRQDMGVFEKSLTRQSERDACDVNLIVKKFDRTGVLPFDGEDGLFIDVSQVGDYQSALRKIDDAKARFMTLPAGVRAKFKNDVAGFLDWASNPVNRDEMIELGLIVKPADKPAASSPAVPPAGPAPAAAPTK